MMDTEVHSIKKESESLVDSNPTYSEYHAGKELPSTHNGFFEQKQVTTEIGTFAHIPIKEEKFGDDSTCSEEDYHPADNGRFPEVGMFEQLPIKEEDSDDDDTSSEDDDTSSEDEERPSDTLLTEKRSSHPVTSSGNDSQIDFCNADKMDLNDGEGGTSAENTASSQAIGGHPTSETDMEHDRNPSASPDLKKVSRKRREKESQNGSPKLDTTTYRREKRSAFKKCTEWFKQLRGERAATYFCDTCNYEFSSKRNLKEHKLVHSAKETNPTNRSVEDSQTNKVKVMAERFETQNGVAALGCQKCGRTFLRKETLVAHMRSHSGSSLGQVREKVRVVRTPVSRVRKYKCDECDARFTQKWSLEQHQLIHTQTSDDLECQECNKKFSDLTLLVKHQKSHSGQKSYGCGECNERFTQKSALFKHQLAHVERRKSECTECDMQFTDRSELKIHYLTVHGTENLCVCTQCNKTFSKLVTLKRHILTHSEKKPFKCPVCKELFAQKSTLNRHALLHGGEKFYRFVCSVCSRKFSRRETLTDHIRTHTGERPFVCGVCHEGFTQKSAMKRHQILHFKEKRGKNSLPYVEVDTGTTDDILLSLVYSDS